MHPEDPAGAMTDGVGMFVQVINGKITDAGAARARGERSSSAAWSASRTIGPLFRPSTSRLSRRRARARSWSRRRSFAMPSTRSHKLTTEIRFLDLPSRGSTRRAEDSIMGSRS